MLDYQPPKNKFLSSLYTFIKLSFVIKFQKSNKKLLYNK